MFLTMIGKKKKKEDDAKVKFKETESRMVVIRGWERETAGQGDGELVSTGYRVSVLQNKNHSGDGGGDGGTI